jgi:hypothetical protein
MRPGACHTKRKTLIQIHTGGNQGLTAAEVKKERQEPKQKNEFLRPNTSGEEKNQMGKNGQHTQ